MPSSQRNFVGKVNGRIFWEGQASDEDQARELASQEIDIEEEVYDGK